MSDYVIDFDALPPKLALRRVANFYKYVVPVTGFTCLVAVCLPVEREYELLDQLIGFWPFQFLPWLLAYCLLTVPVASTLSGFGKIALPFKYLSSFFLTTTFDVFSTLTAVLSTLTLIALADGVEPSAIWKIFPVIIGMGCFQVTLVQLGTFQSDGRPDKPFPKAFKLIWNLCAFGTAVYCIRYTQMTWMHSLPAVGQQ